MEGKEIGRYIVAAFPPAVFLTFVWYVKTTIDQNIKKLDNLFRELSERLRHVEIRQANYDQLEDILSDVRQTLRIIEGRLWELSQKVNKS